MVEQLVDGYELTVGILFDRPLPPIWVDPGDGQWFDYQSKYSPDGAAHRFDLPPVADVAEIQRLCLEAHRVVGCRDLSRVDLMLDRDGRPFLLEINTMPGFTGRSLLPDAGPPIRPGLRGLVRRPGRQRRPPRPRPSRRSIRSSGSAGRLRGPLSGRPRK